VLFTTAIKRASLPMLGIEAFLFSCFRLYGKAKAFASLRVTFAPTIKLFNCF